LYQNIRWQILLPSYDKSGALCSVSLDGISYIERIAYNAKGQRLLIAYGNGIMTRYLYREDNFRLLRMKSEGYVKDGWTYEKQSGTIKQNYTYQYDLSGNIISISDTTPGCGVAGSDSLDREFEYDALYRLLSATGRENANTASLPWLDTYRSADPTLTRAYAQTYEYDKLGNIQSLQHVATGGNFTRAFNYGSPFLNNKLVSIEIGSNTYNFSHDVNGNITSEGDTARHLQYDYADRLRCFFVQTGTAEPSKYTQYLYDGSGQRVKKITRKQGGGYSSTSYIDGIFEYTNETSAFDAIPNLEIGTWVIGQYSTGGEQNILHIMGGATRRIGDSLGDSTPAIKFALADQLGSSNLLVDDNGTNVNREEYYPFGETSFGSYAKKRYKFCGKERDEESGLYYYGMRYYSPWTCRFISVDPMATSYPMKTPYHYCSDNPINNVDPTGAEDQPSGGGGAPGQSGGGNTSGSGGSTYHAEGENKNGIHTVVSGNTLWNLAQRYNVDVKDIIKLNKLTSDTITVGQQIEIPGLTGGASNNAANSSANLYKSTPLNINNNQNRLAPAVSTFVSNQYRDPKLPVVETSSGFDWMGNSQFNSSSDPRLKWWGGISFTSTESTDVNMPYAPLNSTIEIDYATFDSLTTFATMFDRSGPRPLGEKPGGGQTATNENLTQSRNTGQATQSAPSQAASGTFHDFQAGTPSDDDFISGEYREYEISIFPNYILVNSLNLGPTHSNNDQLMLKSVKFFNNNNVEISQDEFFKSYTTGGYLTSEYYQLYLHFFPKK
jgi:RHS repeat-associated protein